MQKIWKALHVNRDRSIKFGTPSTSRETAPENLERIQSHAGSIRKIWEAFHLTRKPMQKIWNAFHVIRDRSRKFGKRSASRETAPENLERIQSHSGSLQKFWNASVNAQGLFPLPSGTSFFVQGGPGVYWPKGGGSDAGFNFGLGFQLPVRAPYRLELGTDYHTIPGADAELLTVQIGVLFR